MKYSDILGKKSSRIILGTAYFGDGISEETAFAMLDQYREMGGTHIDTARLYADGRAEEVVGRWLKSRNANEMLVSTKGGYPTADAPEMVRISEQEIRSDLERSLNALGVDIIDFYWLHRDNEAIPAGQVIEMMNTLLKEGKIKQFGASNWTAERIEKAQNYAKEQGVQGFSASQLRFNPAYIKGERSGLVGMDPVEFAYYQKSNLPVVAYSSQAKGFFSKMTERGESALSQKARDRYLCEENMKKLKVIQKLTKRYSCSIASLICGAFCSFDQPEVFPIIGSRTVSQMEDSMLGADVLLTRDEVKMVFEKIIDNA